ncbi:DUF397 domain-containing protein [Plantactinospora mayteni]|nr:DUF397 domain-containing protein [Plantactinospora mayteni]
MTEFADVTWRKSTRSQNNGACVEVARKGDVIGVRDSKDLAGPVLRFTPAEFATFREGVAKGEFDGLI